MWPREWMLLYLRRKALESDKPWRKSALVRREVVIPIELDAEAFCRAVLTSVGSERPAKAGSIEAVTPSSWRSSGTVVRLDLHPIEGGTTVVVTAWPGAGLFDLGESRRIANRVADRLRWHL